MMSTNKHMTISSINSVNSFDLANDDDMFVSKHSNNRLENQWLADKVIGGLT